MFNNLLSSKSDSGFTVGSVKLLIYTYISVLRRPSVFVPPGAKHPITQVAQSMLDLCDAKLKEVSVNVNALSYFFIFLSFCLFPH